MWMAEMDNNRNVNMANLRMASHNQSTPFFKAAVISKAITTLAVVVFIVTEVFELHSLISLDFDRVFLYFEVWRILTCQVAFESLGELLFGLAVLCPLLRRFEREMSCRKFGTFIVFTFLLASTWELVIFQAIHSSFSDTARASGPYQLIGSLLFLYHTYTPRMFPQFFGFLGFHFSEKAITYTLAFQLIFSGGLATLVPTFAGIAAAFLCVTPALPISRWELPNVFYSVGSRLGQPFLDSQPLNNVNLTRRRLNNNGTGTRQRLIPEFNQNARVRFDARAAPFGPTARPMPRPATAAPSLPVAPPPPDDVVETLTSMGFEREAVLLVLQQCDNNVEIAANRLLNA